jgi:methylglutaconyl-CoA hydratase
MTDIVIQEKRGPILVLTLNDPDRANPLSSSMVNALSAALEEAAADEDVRAVVLRGAGRHFSAGADLEALERVAQAGDEQTSRTDTEQLRHLFEVLLGHPKLTVAAVDGAAVAGGCGLATACDLVVAEPGARFAYTEVKIGFLAAMVLTFLTRRVAGHVARRLLIDPEVIGGTAAVELGLADELADEGEALSAAVALARSICHKASPSALAATKALLNETVGLDWRQALTNAAEANIRQRQQPECRRGVRAFLDTKNTPDWLDESDREE